MTCWWTHICSKLAVATLLIGSVVACSGPDSGRDSTASGSTAATTATVPAAAATSTTVTTATVQQTATTSSTATTSTQPQPSSTSTEAPTSTPEPTATATATPPANPSQGVLPGMRVLSYYGHPNSAQMGILGEFPREEVLAHLQEQAAAYEAADPSRPVKLAFELIATVAQPFPGEDGTYVAYTGDEIIGEYADFAAANDMLLILDLQIGHNSIRNEIERIRHWLEMPHVHVALDPEFSTGPDRVPGEFIGEVDGNHVQIAVEMLDEIVRTKNLPTKILIVHQFESEMIYNKSSIVPLPGVDVVIDMDGFGGQEAKTGNYDIFVRQELIEYGGIKLFYRQDNPLLSPEQIVALDPPPLVVIYQ